ncbi:efflux RND transporter periplasmic adaptor subunit [Marilutibacter spongiae]|uniref:HlyD family efflux transporter periplasmic adaptor subunit n=1 Tax=Marilutibacter spongiae TaxID=2025720 RepID=A0A7W3TPF6_9GAMM|nr:HlyD family efflux transporter periplasmic adaptor subunit [Lysobacter spongiae]MBB1062081.1 HlyD family efflux transporter periplasmic adaptor subunit [Lysobacter spongiae]
MDIARQAAKKNGLRRYWLPIAVGAGVLVLVGLTQMVNGNGFSVDRDKLVFGEVQRGDFSVQVRGIGTLVPKNIQWLTANVDGYVEKIGVEAGAQVKKGDVIVTLTNHKLREELEESRWEMEAQAKENRAAEMSLDSELADLRTEASNAELDYESARLKLDAEGKLVGQGIVSKITYEQSKLAAEQSRQRIESKRARVRKMQENLAAMRDAHVARLNMLKNSHALIQQQIDDLEVRASIDGIVQEMPLKLGQHVSQGIQVARVAPHDDLIALLDVQDFQVRDIELGQKVVIDTRSSKINGTVARIDPAVVNGVVKVEVTLQGELPGDARPDLSVEGVIDVERKADALFVDRPSFAQSHQVATLYKVDGGTAQATRVELGRASTRHIEVVKGLEAGDRIIVSDTSAFENQPQIDIE